jgi:hypothetical protein
LILNARSGEKLHRCGTIAVPGLRPSILSVTQTHALTGVATLCRAFGPHQFRHSSDHSFPLPEHQARRAGTVLAPPARAGFSRAFQDRGPKARHSICTAGPIFSHLLTGVATLCRAFGPHHSVTAMKGRFGSDRRPGPKGRQNVGPAVRPGKGYTCRNERRRCGTIEVSILTSLPERRTVVPK